MCPPSSKPPVLDSVPGREMALTLQSANEAEDGAKEWFIRKNSESDIMVIEVVAFQVG